MYVGVCVCLLRFTRHHGSHLARRCPQYRSAGLVGDDGGEGAPTERERERERERESDGLIERELH